VFGKFGDPDTWLCYSVRYWMVMTTAQKEANNNSGLCYNGKAGLAHPSLAQRWTIRDSSGVWRLQPEVVAVVAHKVWLLSCACLICNSA